MKKLFTVLFSLLLVAVLLPFVLHTASTEAITYSGTCGDDLTWLLDSETGVLSIEGTGEMTRSPWSSCFDYIKEVTIGSGVTSICDKAFIDCRVLQSITIPDSVTSIGDYAFKGCRCLTSIMIPNSVTSIGEGVFRFCNGLTSVAIGKSVKSIGDYAFQGCGNLQEIIVDSDNTAYCAIDYVLFTCDLTKLIAFPPAKATSYTIPDSVTSIGQFAFLDCSGLTSITIPDSVTSIGDGAFEGCSGLTSVTIPDSVTSICERTFSYCDSLTSVTVGNSVTSICESTFYKCTELTSVTIGNSVTSIGEKAFYSCVSLTTVKIPDRVISIGNEAFYDCTNLSSVMIGNGVISIGDSAFYGCTNLSSVTIPDSVTSIGESAFSCCTGLTSVTIPDSVTSIGEFAFSSCTGLTSITIPDSITCILGDTFNNCTGLTTLTLPGSITTIEWMAFYGCTGLTDVYYGGTQEQRDSIDGWGIDYLLNATWHYTASPTAKPTAEPTAKPTAAPTAKPTAAPTAAPTALNATVKFNEGEVEYKGTTPYVVWNYGAHTPGFTVVGEDGKTIDPQYYDYAYKENAQAGTGYICVTFKNGYSGEVQQFFKIYLPATTATTVENAKDGIHLTWKPVEGAAGYVIYRRAWNLKSAGWTDFVRWNNTKDLEWTDTKVYAGTRYQYGIKAYFERRTDPVSGVEIGGNVGDNFNLGMVGPLKTTVRITTRKLTSVKAGTKKMTVKWEGSKVFTGYQIQYALDSKFTKSVKVVKITDAKTMSKVIKKLKTGKKYYVRVRSYHVFEGMTYYGQWSNVKSCKVK